ncbi:MAG: hypothetical protein GKS05_00670 [Nitrospirales bacterium]|nr:hypothetical protein [Nitrospirales bacterium]
MMSLTFFSTGSLLSSLGRWGMMGMVLLASPEAFSQTVDGSAKSSFEEHALSARLIWQTGGKTIRGQIFVKGNRYRIESQGGLKTSIGNASVTIVRGDKQQVWHVLSPRRLVLALPMTEEYWFPLTVALEGELHRMRIGDSMVGEVLATLFDVEVEHLGRRERFYEWVDVERGQILKLVSQDRNWSIQYDHMNISQQPDYFFEPPLGYRTLQVQDQ